MGVYRAARPLHVKGVRVEAGTVSDFAGLGEANIEKFVEMGLLQSVAPPPLAEIPGWTARARKCAEHGITTVEEFLLRDTDELARLLRNRVALIEKWKDELRGWLTVRPSGG